MIRETEDFIKVLQSYHGEEKLSEYAFFEARYLFKIQYKATLQNAHLTSKELRQFIDDLYQVEGVDSIILCVFEHGWFDTMLVKTDKKIEFLTKMMHCCTSILYWRVFPGDESSIDIETLRHGYPFPAPDDVVNSGDWLLLWWD